LKEIIEKYVEFATAMIKSIELLLRQHGVKLEVSVLYRVPAECEDCVDHVITVRVTCPENPEACKKLREALQEELREPH